MFIIHYTAYCNIKPINFIGHCDLTLVCGWMHGLVTLQASAAISTSMRTCIHLSGKLRASVAIGAFVTSVFCTCINCVCQLL